MADDKLKNKVMGGLVWTFGERILAQLVSTIITIILARLLTPEHYGMISIVMVFINFLNVFVTSGFGNALVQKKDADTLDFNTTFVLSLGLSSILYLILFFCAPIIANFYEIPLLNSVLRVMGLRLPLAAISTIQRAYVQREMKFKKFFIVTFVGTFVSGLAGVAMAYAGFEIWALVTQYLGNNIISTLFLFVVCKWRPKFQFSKQRAGAIWNFGWKVLASQLIVTLESDVRSLIVGKVFGTADLAYYDEGKKYPALLMTNISSSIDSVMLSAYSKKQDDKQHMLSMLRRSVKVGVYILAPILLGFAAVSESFVSLVLTEKWLPAVPFMQVFCLSFITRPLESSCRQAMLAIGKSGSVFAIITTINIVTLIGTLIAVFVFESVFAIALVSLITTLVSLIGFMSFSGHYFKYTLRMQLQDVLPSLLIGGLMYAVACLVGQIQGNVILVLLIQIVSGAAVYLGFSVIFKLEPLRYILGMVKSKLR